MSHPSPGQMPGRIGGPGADGGSVDVDATDVGRDVAEILDQVDTVRRAAADAAHDREDEGTTAVDLAPLDAQAVLLEQAHDVLTSALEHLDRV